MILKAAVKSVSPTEWAYKLSKPAENIQTLFDIDNKCIRHNDNIFQLLGWKLLSLFSYRIPGPPHLILWPFLPQLLCLPLCSPSLHLDRSLCSDSQESYQKPTSSQELSFLQRLWIQWSPMFKLQILWFPKPELPSQLLPWKPFLYNLIQTSL